LASPKILIASPVINDFIYVAIFNSDIVIELAELAKYNILVFVIGQESSFNTIRDLQNSEYDNDLILSSVIG
jgi:hypothetical protein